MAQIIGQIESLKNLKNQLNLKGIDRFNSVGEINSFLKNYKSEKDKVYKRYENELENEINNLSERINTNQDTFETIKNESINNLNEKIAIKLKRKDKITQKKYKNYISRLLIYFIVKLLDTWIKYLQNNFEEIVSKSTSEIKNIIIRDKRIVEEFKNNKENIIIEKSVSDIRQLSYIKEVIEDLNLLIAGAIGENLVVNEIKKLTDDFVLINDFSLSFKTPIYNKKENDRIFSIQIDHLLISKSGIYILETKNWSKKSIESIDLRSPVKQINRTSFALFVLLNNKNSNKRFRLDKHHWGEKQIPIRNIVIMINKKPKEEFKYVKIKSLKELIGYITYFDPIFNESEVESISDYLRELQN